ncbi:FKBP-type peptidyl-prolyl cis-trans isomerase [Roseivirga sp. E12]|uniref:FKBP-type peptidyl-prolyl cis-trans isomerase n=1 Tax=Roseivirga sp. E12 TaxID=2819237 RepID=UPI001ABD18F4|nr:FKBP-type peptidyl-prolyl cis-trans isomerase [Roseivirga sp. E12]MBO3700392.1 FKBP-type peptidyl-prolyl cis-trans isomerase [Roseivirga sp. E12]
MKKLLLIASLVLIYSCNNDDAEPYDPIVQLQTDLNLIDAHLANNGQAVVIHPSGIRYTIDNPGQGDFPVAEDSVATQYDIYTLEGRLIDTTNEDLARANGIYTPGKTYDRFEFLLGGGYIIDGYEIATRLLNTNAEGTFYVPSTLAYRNTPGFGLESNAILRIRLKVLEIF